MLCESEGDALRRDRLFYVMDFTMLPHRLRRIFIGQSDAGSPSETSSP